MVSSAAPRQRIWLDIFADFYCFYNKKGGKRRKKKKRREGEQLEC